MLPSFLNPLAALVAAAIAIPALLLLYFLKLRRREQPVASTLLWRKTLQDLQVNAPFQRLRRNLLLLLQLLLLAALLLALARPVRSSQPVAGARTVILIDRSASMNATDGPDGRTRLEEAKRRARALVDTMSRDARAMVIAFDDSARIVQPFTSDTAALRGAIESITPSDRPTSMKLAYELADAQMQFDPEQLRPEDSVDVYVYSDGRTNDDSELSSRGQVKLERIGREDAKNVGIVSLGARRNYESPNRVQVFARLANFGPEPVDAEVQLSVAPVDPANDAAPVFETLPASATVSLLPQRWSDEQRRSAIDAGARPRESVEFNLDLTTAAVLKLRIRKLDGDVLSADDSAAVVVPPPKPLRLLLVTAGNYFLERLVASLGVSEWQKLTPGEYEAQKPGDFDVIVFDNHAPQFVPAAGSFVAIGVAPTGLKVRPVLDPQGRTVFLEDIGVLDWNRDHPILRGLNVGRVYAESAIKLDYPLETEVLIEGLKGPLVLLHREGRATWLLLSFDLLKSNWPVQPTFVPFFLQAVQFLALGSDLQPREALSAGASPLIPRGNLDRALPGGRVTLHGPVGEQRLTVPPAGDLALPPLERVGLYRTSPPVPQFEHLAVNLCNETESNTLPTSRPPGNIGQVVGSGAGVVQTELWWWIIATVAVPLLLVEWWVYTRRVHL
jgi:hypothetical protein